MVRRVRRGSASRRWVGRVVRAGGRHPGHLLCLLHEGARVELAARDPRTHRGVVERAIDLVKPRQDALCDEFRLDDHKRWDWHQDSGTLVFSNDGRPAVIADMQFVGSISTRSRSWLWSWANRSVQGHVRSAVRRVRSYGELERLLKLSCAYWTAEEEDGWQMSAVAAMLLDARGIYRSPDDHGFTFLVMTDVRWAQ